MNVNDCVFVLIMRGENNERKKRSWRNLGDRIRILGVKMFIFDGFEMEFPIILIITPNIHQI